MFGSGLATLVVPACFDRAVLGAWRLGWAQNETISAFGAIVSRTHITIETAQLDDLLDSVAVAPWQARGHKTCEEK